MPQLIIRRCDGGEGGKACKEMIEKAFSQFFACGVKNIEDACNCKRVLLLNEWRSKSQQTIMVEYSLDIPYQRGIEEIAPPFELAEPKTIELYILERERSHLKSRSLGSWILYVIYHPQLPRFRNSKNPKLSPVTFAQLRN